MLDQNSSLTKKFPHSHFLTGEEMSNKQLEEILDLALLLKQERKNHQLKPLLQGKTLVLLFDKPSLRTRLSFSVAASELGCNVIESLGSSRKTEDPEDVIRVLAGYCHGIMIRTFDHNYVERMAKISPIPIINGLTDSHHPCQVMADLLTLKEKFGKLNGLRLSYIGDGNNMLHSLMLLCPRLGIHLQYACPVGFEPNAFVVKSAKILALTGGGEITAHSSPESAAINAHALYTDVWTSMGFEQEEQIRTMAFEGFQLNEQLLLKANTNAIVMHCMPMNRGKEISKTLPDHSQSMIFQQSENRLHVQKAILIKLMSN
jgi:ornithine carbamoyltransferase